VIRDLSISAAVLLFALRLVIPVFSPIGEEPGWRGFALPRLLADRSPFEATLFLGLIVAVWHVPLIFIASEDLPPIFLLTTVAVTFFYTWLFVHTGGSVFITIVAHATEGLIGRELTGDDGWTARTRRIGSCSTPPDGALWPSPCSSSTGSSGARASRLPPRRFMANPSLLGRFYGCQVVAWVRVR
jgi:hypothetical protein